MKTWLNERCEQRNLSWREASIGAGINPGAISAIMNGARPGLEMCKALARFFSVSPEYVLRLAGHLPPNPADGRRQVAVLRHFERAAEILGRLPEDLQIQFADGIIIQAETARAIYEARTRYDAQIEKTREKDVVEPS